jgi:Protein of unknown function (DUF1573)
MVRHATVLLVMLGVVSIGRGAAESYFAEKSHDFGPMPRGALLVHQFQFTNKGKEPLLIVRVRATCTCLIATAPAQRIKPGETASINVQMDTRRFAGPKTETIYVNFKEPQVEEVALRIQANAREEFSMSSDKIAFGRIRVGTGAKTSVQATLAGDPKWEITEVKSESDYVSATAKLLRRAGNEVTFEIAATLRPDLPPGQWHTEIWLRTNNTDVAKVRVPVSVEITSPFNASVTDVDFGDVKVGDAAVKNVLFRGEKAFRIKEIKGSDGVVEVGGKGGDAKMVHVLKVTFKPGKAGDVNRTIELIADEEKAPPVTITVTGKGVMQ